MSTIRKIVISEIRKRLFEESIPRIFKCLDNLTEEETWRKPNSNSNSVGNLILHLNGNVRQWIISGLCGQPDTRERSKEFSDHATLDKSGLKALLLKLQEDVEAIIPTIKHEDLQNKFLVQGFEETGLSIIIHVIEHFSYHTGQIVYYTKFLKDIDTGFYEGLNLDVTKG